MRYVMHLIIIALGLVSCDLGGEPAIEGVRLQAMCGEWWIQVYSEGENVGGGYHLITTANTARNNDTDLILDDHELYPAKVVTNVNLPGLSFNSTRDLSNAYDLGIGVSVVEGRILRGAATTPGGNTTDSIYVKLEFSDDPGVEYEYAGYRRTGFLEDEHH